MTERRYRFFTCDVFTRERFGGNPLAVLPDARGLDPEEMQHIAREFNFSESTFVLPPEAGGDRRVRIFTPRMEVPFAGHPNIGTAFVLHRAGELDGKREARFEEKAGVVPVRIREEADGVYCEIEAPEPLSTGKELRPSRAAAVLSLMPDEILVSTHPPVVASVGLPFLVAEVAGLDSLARARVDLTKLEELKKEGVVPDVLVYCRSGGDSDLRARMFAPFDGVAEDPATGSANAALAALLAERDPDFADGADLTIVQGVEMGRPSVLRVRTEKSERRLAVTIGGYSVPVAEGVLTLD